MGSFKYNLNCFHRDYAPLHTHTPPTTHLLSICTSLTASTSELTLPTLHSSQVQVTATVSYFFLSSSSSFFPFLLSVAHLLAILPFHVATFFLVHKECQWCWKSSITLDPASCCVSRCPRGEEMQESVSHLAVCQMETGWKPKASEHRSRTKGRKKEEALLSFVCLLWPHGLSCT